MSPTLALLFLACCLDDPATVEFGRDVQPILSKHCFVCHGPDQGTRQAELRLDLASTVGEERGILVPGQPQSSELIRRITHESIDERVPPESGRAHV